MGKFLLVVIACVLSVGCSSGGGDSYVPPPTCDELACPETSSCVVQEGTRVCECNEGYAGELCDECAEGFAEKDGVCLNRFSCAYEALCEEGFVCVDKADGKRSCVCPSGFTDLGDECACFGTVEDGACFVDRPCLEVDPCGERGTCADDGEMTTCGCEGDYTGPRCDECAPDRVFLDGRCSPIVPEGDGVCGDGRFEPSVEACDDGNNDPSDGVTDFCSSDCTEHVWPGGEWPGNAPVRTETDVTRLLVELNESPAPYRVVDSGTEVTVKGVAEHDFDFLTHDQDVNLGLFDSSGAKLGESLCLNIARSFGFEYEPSHTVSAQGEFVFTAPAEPGTYYVRWSHGVAIRPCQMPMSNWGPEFNVFVIYVR